MCKLGYSLYFRKAIGHTGCVIFLLIVMDMVFYRPGDESKRCPFMGSRLTLTRSVVYTFTYLLYLFMVAQGIGREWGISCKMKERGIIEWIKNWLLVF